jgi:hypothetical protein
MDRDARTNLPSVVRRRALASPSMRNTILIASSLLIICAYAACAQNTPQDPAAKTEVVQSVAAAEVAKPSSIGKSDGGW